MPLRMSIEASTTRVYGDSSAALGRRRDLRGRRGRAALLVLMVLLGGLFAAVWLWDTGSAAPPGEIGGTQGPERPLEQPSPERVERVSERAARRTFVRKKESLIRVFFERECARADFCG